MIHYKIYLYNIHEMNQELYEKYMCTRYIYSCSFLIHFFFFAPQIFHAFSNVRDEPNCKSVNTSAFSSIRLAVGVSLVFTLQLMQQYHGANFNCAVSLQLVFESITMIIYTHSFLPVIYIFAATHSVCVKRITGPQKRICIA